MIRRSNGSDDQSPDVSRTSQTGYKRGMGRCGTYSQSGWVMDSSLSVSHLKLRQDTVKISRPREVVVPNFTRKRLNHGTKNHTRRSIPRCMVIEAGRAARI